MEAIKNYVINFLQSEMVQDALHSFIAFILSFVDMNVVHDEVFIIIFAILIFIGLFFLLAVFTKGITRAISIGFAFLMMIGAMTLYGLVGSGLLQVQFDEDKLAARAEMQRKQAEQNRPPQDAPAVPQVPLDGDLSSASAGRHGSGLGLPEAENIHWEIYDPYEKPQSLTMENGQPAAAENSINQAHSSQIATSAAPKESAEKQAMRAEIGRQLAIIETELSFNISYIDEHLQELDRQLKSGEIDQKTALSQKARWGIEEQGMILDAMDDKVAVLMSADLLNDTDKASDLRAINERRQKANDIMVSLQNALNQLEAGN